MNTKQTTEEKKTKGYVAIPVALSIAVLSRVLPKDEVDRITALYVEERNRNLGKKHGSYCPHCGKKLPIVTQKL